MQNYLPVWFKFLDIPMKKYDPEGLAQHEEEERSPEWRQE